MAQDDTIFAFVLMPFDSQFDDVYKLGIKEAASDLGIRAERVDEQFYNEGILDRIYKTFTKILFLITLYISGAYNMPVFRNLTDILLDGCRPVVGLARV